MTIATENSVEVAPFVDEHDCLKRLIVDVRQLLIDQRASQHVVSSVIAELAESVRLHFVHEEVENGFFESVIDQAPWLKDQAGLLIDEHCDMAAQLSQLQWRSRHGGPSAVWWQDVAAGFEAFCAMFLQHERRENELLQTAFYQDIGAED